MIQPIVLILCMVAVMTSFAETTECEELTELARVIMTQRQAGVPATLVVELVPEHRTLVQTAYGYPRFNTEGRVERIIDHFANEVNMECYRK